MTTHKRCANNLYPLSGATEKPEKGNIIYTGTLDAGAPDRTQTCCAEHLAWTITHMFRFMLPANLERLWYTDMVVQRCRIVIPIIRV